MGLESALSGLYQGAKDFAGTGLGQTVIGAGVGYGADRLMGGSGNTGLLLGGLGGFGNSMTSGQDFMSSGNFADSSMGGLFGQGSRQKYAQGVQDRLTAGQTIGFDEGQQIAKEYNALPTQANSLSGLYSNNKDMIGHGIDAFQKIGKYQSDSRAADRADAELGLLREDYNRRAAISDREQANMAATNQGAIDAHKKSSLNSYYYA